MNSKNQQIIIYAAVAVGLIVLFKVGNAFGGAIDSVKDVFGAGSAAQKAKIDISNIESLPDKENPFKPEYMISRLNSGDGKKRYYLTAAAKKDIINKIKDAGFWGIFGNSAAATIEQLFKTISHKNQVSDLANAFRNDTGADLLTYLKNKIQKYGIGSGSASDNTTLAAIIEHVGKLPE